MKFPIPVLHELAKKLRSREHASRYNELSAYNNALLHQNYHGDNPFTSSRLTLSDISVLAYESGDLENYFPLPYARTHICEPKHTIQFNDLTPIVLPPEEDFYGITMGGDGRWSIIAQGDDNKWYMLANEDVHFFEPGELIREVSEPDAKIIIGHCHLFANHVAWEIRNWLAASLILGDNSSPQGGIEITRHQQGYEPARDDIDTDKVVEDIVYAPLAECAQINNVDWTVAFAHPLLSAEGLNSSMTWVDFVNACDNNNLDVWDFTRKRPEPDTSGSAGNDDEPKEVAVPQNHSLILETLSDVERTFVSDDVFEVLGVKCDPNIPTMSVADLIMRLMTVEVEPAKNQIDVAMDLDVVEKVHKALNIDAIVAEVKALPLKKRTKKALNNIIPKYLEEILASIKK